MSRTPHRVRLRGGSVQIWAGIRPDHGYRSVEILKERLDGAEETKLGSRTAVVRRFGNQAVWIVPLGRQNLVLQVRTNDGADFSDAALARIFLPTLKRDDG